jgi:hypothetical protein
MPLVKKGDKPKAATGAGAQTRKWSFAGQKNVGQRSKLGKRLLQIVLFRVRPQISHKQFVAFFRSRMT